ncbi:MAG: hypothetical protein FJ304_11010 [Planctomycetes bacterium]|nr:hypothetical protein [Planctomycetota bacterium]
MADGKYEVLALLPESSDFTLDAALAHFGKLRFGKKLKAELATLKGRRKPSGFRVDYGGWSVYAFLESGKDVLSESREFAEDEDLPAPADVIAGCSRRLSVWSDEDEEADYSDHIMHFTDELRERFGAFILDFVNGGWWR